MLPVDAAAQGAARRLVLARQPLDRRLERERPLPLRHAQQGAAPRDLRRQVERDHQRHHRLGVRGGVRIHEGLRLLARQPPHRLPALRREPRAPVRNDALRRRALQQGLYFQIPEGGRRQLRGAALGLRHRRRPQHAHRHGCRHRPVHPPPRLDARRTPLLLPAQPPPEPLRGGAVRSRRLAARDLCRDVAPLRRARERPRPSRSSTATASSCARRPPRAGCTSTCTASPKGVSTPLRRANGR